MEGFRKPGQRPLWLPEVGPDTRGVMGEGRPRDGAPAALAKRKTGDGDVAQVKSTGGGGWRRRGRIASWMVRRNMACASICPEFHGGVGIISRGRFAGGATKTRGVAAAGSGGQVGGPPRRSEGPSRRCGRCRRSSYSFLAVAGFLLLHVAEAADLRGTLASATAAAWLVALRGDDLVQDLDVVLDGLALLATLFGLAEDVEGRRHARTCAWRGTGRP